MKKFTLGVISGASSLAIAVPLLAQFTSAATEGSSSTTLAVPSQECVAVLAEKDTAMLSHFDTMMATHKSATAAHRDALLAAAQIADDAARKAALEKAEEDFHTALRSGMESQADTMDELHEKIRTACGDTLRFHGHKGKFLMKFGGPMHGRKMLPMRFQHDDAESASSQSSNE
ncbi:MAG: hypothetical protein Q7R81_03275 [Candidatus Peregrinibacteria bacterium]|nr:hypothetical protein [Candidatus Peregrinibacteria bacterium]